MKSFLILSDTHGNTKETQKLFPLFKENDFVLHLGDGAGEARMIMREYPEKLYACAGNCDFSSPFPLEGVLEVERVRVFYCHGHLYQAKTTLERLVAEAKRRDCQLVLYGHTHEARIDEIEGITLVNPGTMRYPLHQGGSYCYLALHGEKITPVIVGQSLR